MRKIKRSIREVVACALMVTAARQAQGQTAGNTGPEASSSAVTLPSSEGSVDGMNAELSASLSTGAAQYVIPLRVAPGRLGVEPSLSLSYDSRSGNSVTGLGWSIATSFITRSDSRGVPRYVGGTSYHAAEDRFEHASAGDLVPISSAVTLQRDGIGVPSDLAGYQEYRPRIESGFARFFRSPDASRWVVLRPDGRREEYGQLATGPATAVASSSAALVAQGARIYRWYLTRESDRHGSTIYYVYETDSRQVYLSSIYYVSPQACGVIGNPAATRSCNLPLDQYGARVRLVYENRPDTHTSYASGFAVTMRKRLRRVEVTAGANGQRTLVRRYHLSYEPSSYHSLLSSVQLEGRPHAQDAALGVFATTAPVSESSLGDSIVGALLPAMRLTYTGAGVRNPEDGFPELDSVVREPSVQPQVGLANSDVTFFDVNTDGLPDIVRADATAYQTAEGEPAFGVFFNGYSGAGVSVGPAATFSPAVPVAIRSEVSQTLKLTNQSIVRLDIDGTGTVDFLHMPRQANYGYFVAAREDPTSWASPADAGYRIVHVPVALSAGETDPRIDLSQDASSFRVIDVDADGLLDVVQSTGNALRTWMNLGYLQGGDGRFGSAQLVNGQWQLSTAPVETCLPSATTAVSFADSTVHIGDMNGDAVPDIARLRSGKLEYWPGRGAGQYGTSDTACTGPGFVVSGHVSMTAVPTFSRLDNVVLVDIDEDGLLDIAQVASRVAVWFNRGGTGFTNQHRSERIPRVNDVARSLALLDIDGTGTDDLVFAQSGSWWWLDPMGGRRHRLLASVENGLGARTDYSYGSSVEDYLRDLAATQSCTGDGCDPLVWNHTQGGCDQKLLEKSGECVYRSGRSPIVATVVRSVTTTDQFEKAGREPAIEETRYAYHNAYYEGVERSFHGFGVADAIRVGDEKHPTGITRQWTHVAARPSEVADDRLKENPYASLLGRPFLVEVYDAQGVFLSTRHSGYAIRKLFSGLDGRPVEHAHAEQLDELRYSTVSSAPSVMTAAVPHVRRLIAQDNGTLVADTTAPAQTRSIRARNGKYAHLRQTVVDMDLQGQVRTGIAWGRIRGEHGESVEERIVLETRYALVDPAAWLWREVESYRHGADESEVLGRNVNTHNAVGDVTRVVSMLTIAGPFDFSGDARGAEGFSMAAGSTVHSSQHDAWGNVIVDCGGADLSMQPDACLRLKNTEFDTTHGQFLERERVTIRSGVELTTQATFDRGYGEVTSVTEPSGAVSSVTRDGFGRTTVVRKPKGNGCPSTDVPVRRFRYTLPGASSEPAAQVVSMVETLEDRSCSAVGADLGVTRSYLDGRGRVRATLTRAEAPHGWARSEITSWDKRGGTRKATLADAIPQADPTFAQAVAMPSGPATYTSYDAFDRGLCVRGPDDGLVCHSYHALSEDECDALDMTEGTLFSGTCTTRRFDGHGREIDIIQRNRREISEPTEILRLWSTYRADGSLTSVTRAQTSDDAPRVYATIVSGRSVTRTFFLDSLGRRIASSDADTNARAAGKTLYSGTWRYLHNAVDDLVAVRDPRGCGRNYYYDLAGRRIGERYVGCADAQSHERPVVQVPAGSVAMARAVEPKWVDARFYFDSYPEWATGGLLPTDPGPLAGRETATQDRAQRITHAYDLRGNVIRSARQVAWLPTGEAVVTTRTPNAPVVASEGGVLSTSNVAFDEAHTYVRETAFDHAGRVQGIRLPRDPDYSAGPAPVVGGRISYNARGLPNAAYLRLDNEEKAIFTNATYTYDGHLERITYGNEAADRRFDYDIKRRPARVWTTRTPTLMGDGSRSLSSVSIVTDQTMGWDQADNLVSLSDGRIGVEWPVGHRPQSVSIEHDALYRVTRANYSYTHDDQSQRTLDAATDFREELARLRDRDPMKKSAAPRVSELPDQRVMNLQWEHDWLSNLTEWTDDAGAFHERSLGLLTHGEAEPGGRPSALRFASNLPEAAPATAETEIDRGGYLFVDYTEGGNVARVDVHGQCHDSATNGQVCWDDRTLAPEMRAQQLAQRCQCSVEQRYEYRWDEVNRLADARRYDRTGVNYMLATHMRYRYDADNQRVVKEVSDQEGARVALYIYGGDFERRGLVRSLSGTYEATPAFETETQYLVGGTRVVWKGTPKLGTLDPDHRVTYALGDLLDTTSAVIDLESKDLVEVGSYLPNGARETLRSNDQCDVPSEPLGFTGKEADEEVGLTYFGERYLMPYLGHWASPDPAEIHDEDGGGEALNQYHYISGNLLQARDPIGLYVQYIWQAIDAYSKWKKVKPYYTLAKKAYKNLEVVKLSNEIDKLSDDYKKVENSNLGQKDKDKRIEKIRKRVTAIESELGDMIVGVDIPTHIKLSSMSAFEKQMAGVGLDVQAAVFANLEKQRIAIMKGSGDLPPDPMAWSKRRVRLVEHRDLAYKFSNNRRWHALNLQKKIDLVGDQMTNLRNMYQELKQQGEPQESLDIIEADYYELDAEYEEFKDAQDQAEDMAEAAKEYGDHLDAKIKAGDAAEKARK